MSKQSNSKVPITPAREALAKAIIQRNNAALAASKAAGAVERADKFVAAASERAEKREAEVEDQRQARIAEAVEAAEAGREIRASRVTPVVDDDLEALQAALAVAVKKHDEAAYEARKLETVVLAAVREVVVEDRLGELIEFTDAVSAMAAKARALMLFVQERALHDDAGSRIEGTPLDRLKASLGASPFMRDDAGGWRKHAACMAWEAAMTALRSDAAATLPEI